MDGPPQWDVVLGDADALAELDFLLDDSLLAAGDETSGQHSGNEGSALARNAATFGEADVASSTEWRCLHGHTHPCSCEPPPPAEEDRNWELVGDVVRGMAVHVRELYVRYFWC